MRTRWARSSDLRNVPNAAGSSRRWDTATRRCRSWPRRSRTPLRRRRHRNPDASPVVALGTGRFASGTSSKGRPAARRDGAKVVRPAVAAGSARLPRRRSARPMPEERKNRSDEILVAPLVVAAALAAAPRSRGEGEAGRSGGGAEKGVEDDDDAVGLMYEDVKIGPAPRPRRVRPA